VTPEDGLDITARTRTNVVLQSVVLTRTMDYWGRTGGVSIVLPYLDLESIPVPIAPRSTVFPTLASFGK
jgi:hypothetical protein